MKYIIYLKLAFIILLFVLFFPQKALAYEYQQTLIQSDVNDRSLGMNAAGSAFNAYYNTYNGRNCSISSPCKLDNDYGWMDYNYNDSTWGYTRDAFQSNYNEAYQWWCVDYPANCNPIPGVVRATGPGGFRDGETYMIRKKFTVSPPAGYRTKKVELLIWSDNDSWASINGTFIVQGGLDRTTYANVTSALDMTSAVLSGYSTTQTFSKQLAVQVSNDIQGAYLNPIGTAFKIVATYEQLVTLSGRAYDAGTGQGIAGVTITACNLPSAVTDANGNYSIPNVVPGQGFCLRPSAASGYSSPPAPSAYECQKAGGYMYPDACGTNGDLTADNAYNFAYTNPNPGGAFDAATCNANLTVTASGWACDSSNFAQPVDVHFYRDGPAGGGGVIIGTTTANGYRGDLLGVCGGNGNHAFNFTSTTTLTAGAHTIYAYAINTPPGSNPLLGTKPITCNNTPPQVRNLNVYNSSTSQTTFSGTYKVSGNQTNQSGSNWLNPMNVTLGTQQGTAAITENYMAFYTGALASQTNFVANMKAKLNADPTSGVLLAYAKGTDTGFDPGAFYHYVWQPNSGWIRLSTSRTNYTVTNGSTQLYNVNVSDVSYTPNKWKVDFKSAFGSKTMNTGGFIKDSSGLEGFNANLAPTPAP